ncbi:MAG: hypothetical protein HPY67_03100 [Syntrophaceae bacterium]|nr:hypothetical protein [Syntrophaceae bacterium]
MDDKISREAEAPFRDAGRKVYELTDVVEEPRIDALVGGRLQDEIMKKVAEIAERVAREQFPAIAERIIREEIETLKKTADESP